MELTLWDTAGQEEYDQIRILAYKGVGMSSQCFETLGTSNRVTADSETQFRHDLAVIFI